MIIDVKLAKSDADIERISGVLLELRTNLTKESLVAQIKEQQKNGYQVAFAESDGAVAAVAGFVIGTKLAWGKHIYVDDLVTSERCRSSGIGARLIDWLKSYAREHGCRQMHLDSGVQRFGAHRFYLRHGFDISSHHFALTDLS